MVMLRGLARSSSHWLGFDKKMAEHFQVICIDARGIGRSTASVPWRLGISDMAQDVIRVLDKLKIQSSHVFGVSLGGMIAMSLGMEHPERVKTLSIVNSSVGGERKFRLSPAAAATILKGIVSGGRLHEELANLLTGANVTAAKKKILAKKWANIEENEGRPIVTAIKQIGAALHFNDRKRLSTIVNPVLVISGMADRFVPPIHSQTIHKLIPGSQLALIEGGGHEVTDDHPEEVLRAVRDFVRDASHSK